MNVTVSVPSGLVSEITIRLPILSVQLIAVGSEQPLNSKAPSRPDCCKGTSDFAVSPGSVSRVKWNRAPGQE